MNRFAPLLFRHHVAKGLDEAEAARRAEESFAINDDNLRYLTMIHQGSLDRFGDSLAGQATGISRDVATDRSVDAILFWGAVTAVIGFMGTWAGLFKSFEAMRRLGLKSVQVLFVGLSEAHITTTFGLGVLLAAGFLWFGLRLRIERRRALAG